LVFGSDANEAVVSDFSREVIKDILRAAKLPSALITSTARTPEDQARIMYENCEDHGVTSQKNLYAAAGDEVIDVYVAGKAANKNKADTILDMTAKIRAVGPSNVSKHIADPTILNVVDIAPSSLSNKVAFETAGDAEARVNKFLKPPGDPSYHLEIPQP
jgi:hypothetical protein